MDNDGIMCSDIPMFIFSAYNTSHVCGMDKNEHENRLSLCDRNSIDSDENAVDVRHFGITALQIDSTERSIVFIQRW